MPSVQTTEHVPVPPRPEGSINALGNMKYQNKVTGRNTYISRRTPITQDQYGNYTHSKTKV